MDQEQHLSDQLRIVESELAAQMAQNSKLEKEVEFLKGWIAGAKGEELLPKTISTSESGVGK